MSYIDVGKDYEDRLLKRIEDDSEEGCIFPCFSESCTNEILQMRVSSRLEEALNDPRLNLPVIISIFGQYLADTYNVDQEDIEFMCQVVIQGLFKEIETTALTAVKLIDSGEAFIDSRLKPSRKYRSRIINFPRKDEK